MKKLNLKKNIFGVMGLCAIVCVCTGVFVFNGAGRATNSPVKSVEEPILNIASSSSVWPMYFDTTDTIDELVADSELIIMGKVTKIVEHEKGLSMISEINIKDTYMGEVDKNKIEVLQLKGNNVLEEGKSYFLILKKQSDTENQYYIAGGTQGIFEVDGKKLKIADEKMNNDFDSVKLSNDYKSDLTELEMLVKKVTN